MEVRNARYIDDTRIDCEINHPVHGWIPYTLDPNDTDTTVDNVALMAAMAGNIAPYVPPSAAEVAAAKSAQVRAHRDALLAESDWVVTKAIEQNAQDGLGVQIPVVWLDYRQALRDIPQQPGFPGNVTWPTAP